MYEYLNDNKLSQLFYKKITIKNLILLILFLNQKMEKI